MRCAHCPVREGLACLGEKHAPACRRVAQGQPGRAEQLVAMAEGRRFVRATDRRPVHSPPPRPPGDDRVRVGVLSPCCNLGGADRWVADLMGAVDPTRVRWIGAVARDDTGIPINPTVRALWERHAPFGAGPDAIRDLAARSDLLVLWGGFHSWGFPADLLARLVGDTPLLVVSHGSSGDSLTDPAGRFPLVSAAGVSGCSLRGLPPSLRPGARVILNAIDPARVAPTRPAAETRAALGIPEAEGAKVVGYLARMAPDKRPAVFLDALALLPPEWVGLLVGGGYGSEEARAHGDRVAPTRAIWLGERQDVGDVLAAMDCLCMPSATEACSLAAAEAWLAGVPLISTPVGLLESDRPELARLIVNPPTGADLAGAILADAADPEGTAARAARARDYAATELTMPRFGRDWTEAILAACPLRVAATPAPGLDPAIRDAVNACPDRGPVLPLSLQDQSGCGCGGGPELTECRAGKGARPGRVTLRECLACKTA